MMKQVSELGGLCDREVVDLLQSQVRLSFTDTDLYRRRIDRMQGDVYIEASQILLRLQQHPGDRSTGLTF